MRLAVFGENSRTKQYLVNRALGAGYEVVTLRGASPSKLRERTHLTLIDGDAANTGSVSQVVRQSDAVVCFLGNQHGVLDKRADAFMRNIIRNMERNGVERLVVFSANAPAEAHRKSPESGWSSRIRTPWMHKGSTDLRGLLAATPIDWTIVDHPPKSVTLHDDIAEGENDPDKFRTHLAKYLLGQVTDASNVLATVRLPLHESA